MGKLRTPKDKKASKRQKRWKKGQSSSSNPVITKNRELAKGRYFGSTNGKSVLTSEALERLNSGNDISLDNASGDDKTEANTFNTWATNYTECTNATFGCVHRYWASNNIFHKQILAALAAVAETIKTHGGQETDTEYFAALIIALETFEGEESLAAVAYLLSLVTKRVPSAVLKSRFSEISKVLTEVLGKHIDSNSTSLLKSLLSCIATILRVQDAAVWGEASTVHMYNGLLSFAMHPKPKVRKALKECISMILKRSSCSETVHNAGGNISNHPASSATAKFCLQRLEKVAADGEPADIIHLLNLMRDVLAVFPEYGLKSSCETVLRLMTLSNVMVTGVCFEVLNTMFSMHPSEKSLSAELNAKIITALYDFVPNVNDTQLMPAWLVVMENAHCNLARLDARLSVGHLPRITASAMACLLSERRENAMAATITLKKLFETCVGALGDGLAEYIQLGGENTAVHRLVRLLEAGLSYQYHSSWDVHLQLLASAFGVLGKQCPKLLKKCLTAMGSLRESHGFACTSELDYALGVAIAKMGPKAVLEAMPLQLASEKGEDSILSRSWLLPILRETISNTELAFFASFFMPLAAKFKDKAVECTRLKQFAQQKVYETLVHQIWSLLPGFCDKPTDVVKSFQSIAKTIGTIMSDRADLRMTVMASLRKLVVTCQDNAESCKEVAKFGKNFLPILLNLFTAQPEPGHEKDTSRLAVLETFKVYLQICEEQIVHSLFDKCMGKLSADDVDAFKRNALLDVAISMVKYVDRVRLVRVCQLVKPQLQSADKTVQKKAYRFLEEICGAKSDACKNFMAENLAEFQSLLIQSLSSSSSPSKAPRLRCLTSLFRQLDSRKQDFLEVVVPEAILCTREVAERARAAAYGLLVEIGTALQRWAAATASDGDLPKTSAVTDEYFQLVMAGLAGSPHMIHSTLLAMSRLLLQYRKHVSMVLLCQMLDNCCVLLRSKSREIVLPALGFLKVVIGSFETTELAQHLENIITSLVEMKDNNKHHLRFKTKEIYARLIRKFGYEVVRKMVPESHYKILQNIRKVQERAKKRKDGTADGGSHEPGDEDELLPRLSLPQSASIDDILHDTDSEGEDGDSASRSKTSAQSKRQTWLRDNTDKITDFLDAGMAKNLTASKPLSVKFADLGQKNAVGAKQGFKLASDGRLLITDKDDSDDNEQRRSGKRSGGAHAKGKRGHANELDAIMDEFEAKQPKGKKRKMEADAGDDDGMSESASVTASSAYQPGGRGIHRQIGKRRDEPKKERNSVTGETYRAKKAGGDMKRSGMPDPYAYIPLNVQTLNKRKQAKLKGQFKGFVGAARKGAQKGMKAMSRKGKPHKRRTH